MTFHSSTRHNNTDDLQFCEQQVAKLNKQHHNLLNKTALAKQLDNDDLYQMLLEQRPHLFADVPVFVSEATIARQSEIIAAIEKVIALPAYQQKVLGSAPVAAQFRPKARGVFFGYDFHLSNEGPKLIEINTNAGGAFVNALIQGSQDVYAHSDELPQQATLPEQVFISMFLSEWRAERGEQPLRHIAIVDECPEGQFMLPEFILCQKMFEQQHIQAVICDPVELSYHEGGLWYKNNKIDLIYNRLTDFDLEAPAHQAIRKAYLASEVVVTPHPRAHALYANKKNLSLLTDEAVLLELGVDETSRNTLLTGIAHTICVKPEEAKILWENRKALFFKPAKGYGSKAAYRGAKLTSRVFDEILESDYVAQALVPPSERELQMADEVINLKVDLRHYVYDGKTQLVSARLYQGQTTNFRTPGGGFAGVFVVPCFTAAPSPSRERAGERE